MSDQQQNPYQQYGSPGPHDQYGYGQQDDPYAAQNGPYAAQQGAYGDAGYGQQPYAGGGYAENGYGPGDASYAAGAYASGGHGHPQDPQAAPQTQTWQGTTWETQVPSAPASVAAESTHLPPQQAAGAPRQPAPQARQAAAQGTAPRDAAPQDLSGLAPNQRARALGHSPIIPPGIRPAALTAGLAVLLALTAPLAQPVLAVVVVLLQAVTAAGWFRLNGMWPARQGIALAFLGGLVTDVALLATDRADAPVVAIGTLGVWCLLVLVLQLRNRSSADERMYALTAGLTSSALAVLAAGHLAAAPHATAIGAVAVAVATLARALPLPSAVSIVLSLVAATGAGIAAGQLGDYGAAGAFLGLAAGGCALIGLRVASYDYPSRFVHMTAGVALPLTLAAPAVYVLGRTLG